MTQNKWFPLSSTAYGANAVYIPEWGKEKNLDIIMVMNQNYPEFKTHPVMDCFHGYISGIERFDHNHEYRVIGWHIDPSRNFWSFIYLPTKENNVRAIVKMRTNRQGRLLIEIEMQNPSPENREWQFSFYITPGYGLELPGFDCAASGPKDCSFEIDGMKLELSMKNMDLQNTTVCDSNGWINFPLNAEASYSSDYIVNRYKKRLKISTLPITIPENETVSAQIDIAPSKEILATELPPPPEMKFPEKDLPYIHALWEALHNRQYVSSSIEPDKMTARVVPARQWYKFFIWDAGMTAIGALELDEDFAEDIIKEMPDPDISGNSIFNHGSLIVTALYAMWELYQKNLNKELLAKYYPKLKRLLLFMYSDGAKPEYEGIVPVLHGTGADDNPASFYVNNEIFTWDYKKTLPVNPDRKKKILLGVGMTAHALRGLKTLRLIAHVLEIKEDEEYFSELIEKSETTLNRKYWDNACGCYLDRIADEKELLPIPWIYNWLPLFSDSVDKEKTASLLPKLYDGSKFMTPHGLTLVAQDDNNFRQDGYPNGSAWPPLQYFFWKTAYNIGEMRLARILSEKWLDTYEVNHNQSLCCWEEFRCKDGRGAGNSRFSGFQTPVVAIWAARRKFGRVQCSQDMIITEKTILADGEKAAMKLHSPFREGKSGLSIVLRPDVVYSVCQDDQFIGEYKTDKYGYMDFEIYTNNRMHIKIALK